MEEGHEQRIEEGRIPHPPNEKTNLLTNSRNDDSCNSLNVEALLEVATATAEALSSKNNNNTDESSSDHRPTRRSLLHNDPEIVDTIQKRDVVLRGSTLLLQSYQAQKLKQQQLKQQNSSVGAVKDPSMTTPSYDSFNVVRDNEMHQKATGIKSIDSTTTSSTYPEEQMPPSAGASSISRVYMMHESIVQDTISMAEGTIPHSVVLATVIGCVSGICAYIYYSLMEFLLDFFWRRLPEDYLGLSSDHPWSWLWIPAVGLTMAIIVGLTVKYMGEPGDLAFTIRLVHQRAFIPMDHVMPMATASLFSIVAGGSLGPEAPLVAICGAIGGFISRHVFGQRRRNIVRKHTLMGMAGALAAFFGCPLGGSLFALEINSRFGIEYFEHMVESIFCGTITMMVFRSLTGLPIAPIWFEGQAKLMETQSTDILLGGLLGLGGAGIAYLFATLHWKVMGVMGHLNLLDNQRAVCRALVGGSIVVSVASLIPHTMFWGEDAFEKIVEMAPSSSLPNVWPRNGGALGFEMDTPFKALIVGLAKIVTVSLSVASGFRGGFIFPFFATGAAFGRFIVGIFPHLNLHIVVLCFAAGINVAITRTSLATTLILTFLSGEPHILPPILAASLCSLFVTCYMPFIKTQIARSDIDHSLFYTKEHSDTISSDYVEDD